MYVHYTHTHGHHTHKHTMIHNIGQNGLAYLCKERFSMRPVGAPA